MAEKAAQAYVEAELAKKADQAALNNIRDELAEKADLSAVATALAAKVNLAAVESLTVAQGASVSVDGIGLRPERCGLLLVMVNGADQARAGLFALDGTESLIKIAGDGLADREDETETCNVYLDEGTLRLQNALAEEITAKVLYFGT